MNVAWARTFWGHQLLWGRGWRFERTSWEESLRINFHFNTFFRKWSWGTLGSGHCTVLSVQLGFQNSPSRMGPARRSLGLYFGRGWRAEVLKEKITTEMQTRITSPGELGHQLSQKGGSLWTSHQTHVAESSPPRCEPVPSSLGSLFLVPLQTGSFAYIRSRRLGLWCFPPFLVVPLADHRLRCFIKKNKSRALHSPKHAMT